MVKVTNDGVGDIPTAPPDLESSATDVIEDFSALSDDEVPSIVSEEGSVLQMTALAMPTVNEVLEDPILQEMAKEMENANYYHVFEVANGVAERYVLERIVQKLPEEKQAAARMVVSYVNYSKVPQNEKTAFLQLAGAYQSVYRIVMTHMLGDTAEDATEAAENRGFTILEATELKGDAELAGIMDQMFIKWEGLRHDCDEKKREELGFTSRWHMTKGDEQGGFVEVPLQEFMSQEYSDANFVLGQLVDELKKLQGNPKVDQNLLTLKVDFYTKLMDAQLTTNSELVHKAWEEAERAFVRQANAPGNRIVSTHSQEWGYAGNESGIAPELTVKVIVPNHPSDVLKARALKDVKERLPALVDGLPNALAGIGSIGEEGVTTVYAAVQSGMQLDFESAGQNLPNHKNIRDEEGVVSNMSPNVMAKRLREAGETLFVHFLPAELLDKVDYNQVLADISMHEMGHNVGDSNAFRDGKDRQGCEEWKASGTEFALASINADNFSDDELIGFVVSQIAQAMRYAQKRGEDSQYPYYLSYLSFMREAQNAGVLNNGGGNSWSLNVDRTALLGFIKTVKDQWVELQHIYESADQAALDVFMQKHFTDFIPGPKKMEEAGDGRIMDMASGEAKPSFMADVAQFIHKEA